MGWKCICILLFQYLYEYCVHIFGTCWIFMQFKPFPFFSSFFFYSFQFRVKCIFCVFFYEQLKPKLLFNMYLYVFFFCIAFVDCFHWACSFIWNFTPKNKMSSFYNFIFIFIGENCTLFSNRNQNKISQIDFVLKRDFYPF